MSSFYEDASLVVIPSGYKTSKIYAEKPTDGSGDLTFTRASGATRVASNGLIEKVRTNLALYSEQLDNAYWIKAGAPVITVTANAGTAPDGTTTADRCSATSVATSSRIYTTTTWGGGEYTLSLYVKNNGGTNTDFRFSYYDSVNQYFSPTITLTNEWQRVTYTFTPAAGSGGFWLVNTPYASGNLDLLAWGAQLEYGVATNYIPTTTAAVSVGPVSNVPRLDYLGSTCPRLLLEPQRTNLVQYSEQFDNSYWLNSGLSLSVNSATSPDGYANADIATETAATSQHGLSSGVISFTSGTTYTFSAFAKNAPSGRGFIQLYGYQLGSGAANVFANFDLNTGVVGTATGGTSAITNYGNGWYRCTFTFTCGNSLSERINLFNVTSASATAGQSYAGDITKAIYWYGAQVEAGAYATSYIPTLAASVTRVADAASKTGISSLIGQTEGTLFLDVNITKLVDNEAIATINSGGYANNTTMQRIGNAIQFVRNSATQSGASVVSSSAIAPGRHKMAIAYKSADTAFFLDGVQVSTTQTETFTNGTLSVFAITGDAIGAIPFSDSYNQALLFKTRLTNAEMASLTSL